MIYQVECDKGHRYTVETEPIRDESHLRPYVCGACGSKDIRVWALVYDALTIAIRDRKDRRKAPKAPKESVKVKVESDEEAQAGLFSREQTREMH